MIKIKQHPEILPEERDLVTRVVQCFIGNSEELLEALFSKLTHPKVNQWSRNRRAWILRITCETLKKALKEQWKPVGAAMLMSLDHETQVDEKLRQFPLYFSRLSPEDQILLVLHDRFQISASECSMALEMPLGTLQFRRAQALKTLEDWIWVPK